MTERADLLGGCEMESLVLRALVRKLVNRGLLSEDDVRALLLDAAKSRQIDGSNLTPGAALDLVREQLAPVFLGQ